MRWAIFQIPSMAIDGPSMPIGKSCDGHRWASMGPSMGLNGVSVRDTCESRGQALNAQ